MAKTVKIRLNGGDQVDQSIREGNTYLFATNGKKYLPIVLTASVDNVNITSVDKTSTGFNPRGHNTQIFPIIETKVKKLLSGEVYSERSGVYLSSLSVNNFATKNFNYTFYLKNVNPKFLGTAQCEVNMSYYATIKDFNEKDNIYVFAADTTNNAKYDVRDNDDVSNVYLYIPWKRNSNDNSFVSNGEPYLSNSISSSFVETGSTTGIIRYKDYPTEPEKQKFVSKYDDALHSNQWVMDGTQNSYTLHSLYLFESSSLIPHKTRMVQIPNNDIRDGNTVDLHFDGTYLTQTIINTSEVNIISSHDTNTLNVTYSGLVVKNPTSSYVINNSGSYVFSYTFFNEPTSTSQWRIEPTNKVSSDDYSTWKKRNTIKHEWIGNNNKVAYSLNQTVSEIKISEGTGIEQYGYITYMFSYETNPSVITKPVIVNGQKISIDIVNCFVNDSNVNTTLSHNESGWVFSSDLLNVMKENGTFIVDYNKYKEIEYNSIQFSDDAFETTTDILCDKNHKTEVYSSSSIFYLKIKQHSNFGGYVPKISTSNDLNYYQVLDNSNKSELGWKFAFVCNSSSNTTSEIYVGIPRSDIEYEEASTMYGGLTSLYDVVIKVKYRNNSSKTNNESSKEATYTLTNSQLIQRTEIIDSTIKTTTSATANTKYYWTDDIFNRSGHIYTYAIPIVTASGLEYFGVRSKKHNNAADNRDLSVSTNISPVSVSEGTYVLGYNLPCNIVSLASRKENDYIYSFKNGTQYLKISDKYKGKDLFPTYLSSLSHILNHDKSKPDYYLTYTALVSDRVNLNVDSIYDLYDETTGELKPNYVSYYINASYTETNVHVSNYEVVKNSSTFEPVISEVYEGKYSELTDVSSICKYDKLYGKEISYTQLKVNNYNYIKSKELTSNDYFFKLVGKTYIPYTLSELQNLTKSDTVYEKYVIYKEISNLDYNKTELTTYVQDFDYDYVNKDLQPTYTRYYAKNGNTYIPQSIGIVTDDSIQYYAYTYVLLTDAELLRYKNKRVLPTVDDVDGETLFEENSKIFIKENYRVINSEEEFYKLLSKGAKIYTNPHSAVTKNIIIPETKILDDIDLSGKTIYLDDNGKAIDLSRLKSLVAKQIEIASAGLTTQEEIVAQKELVKNHTITGITTFAANNVVSKVNLFDFNNKYVESDIKEWTEDKKLYVNEEGFTKIPNNLISVGSAQEYYTWRIDKVTPNQVRSLNNQTDLQTYVFVDATEFLNNLNTFDGKTGIYTHPITEEEIIIAKVNKYGFIEDNSVIYYNRTIPVEITQDIYLHPNKIYYKNVESKVSTNTLQQYPLVNTQLLNDGESKHIIFTDVTIDPNLNNYEFNWDDVKYSANVKVIHELSDIGVSNPKQFPSPIPDNEYIETDLLYSTYTINDGILKSSGGAYYTNIYVFDKNYGSVSKTLYLNQHIVNVDKYTYTGTIEQIIEVTSDAVIQNISPNNYQNYGYTTTYNNDIKWLNEISESPAYYFNSQGYKLYTKVLSEEQYDYTCSTSRGAYHYWNNSTYSVNTCVVDDNLFGIICPNYNISVTPESYTYNIFDLEVVKLYKFNTQSSGQLIQDNSNEVGALSKSIPFALTNDVTYTKTGTYQWHPSLMTYNIYTNDGLTYMFTENEIEKVQGYWTTNYERNIIPLHVASYTFYPSTDTISNVTATYSFVPNSYVLSSKVEYPEIAYKTINIETDEYIYYTYINNGIEQKYTNNKIQVNDDLTYTGLIEKTIFSNEVGKFVKINKPINLIQHKEITKNSQVSNIVVQEKHEETNLFAYKTSLALTNEKVPILYNTELMPATTQEIQYWDEEKSSYEIKTVIASYAYYAYQYMYDTVPLKIASYLYQASYLTIDNWDGVGTYIEKATKSLSTYSSALSKGFDKWASKYSTLESSKIASINKAYDLISKHIKNGFVDLSVNVNKMSNNVAATIKNSAANISKQEKRNSKNLVTTLSKNSTVLNSTLNELNTYVSYNIEQQTNTLATGLNTISSYIKHIIIGGDGVEMSKETDIVTYNGLIVSYTSTADPTLNTLGELIARAFITAETSTYQYTDTYGYTHNIINYTYTGLSDVLKRIQIVPGVPTKQEFVMDLAPRMFANCDFDTEIVDDVKYDENGNITEKKTHKNNPTDMAKKIIYRAGVLWDELSKAGYCEDNIVERKQEKLLAIKTASQAALNASTPEEKTLAANDLAKAVKTKIKK